MKIIRKTSPFSKLFLEPLEERWVLDGSNLFITLPANAIPNYQAGAYARGVQLTHGYKLLPNVYEAKFTGITENQAITTLKANKKVAQVTPDTLIQINKTPNDPRFPMQYGLQNTGQNMGNPGQDISATKAWEKTTGKGSTLVAVIDTGIDYTHPDLAQNIWTNPGEIPGNKKDDDGNGYVDDVHGFDFANHDSDPMDDEGHGTHVAGIIGAVGNNGIGVAGVNWNVKMMSLKFLNSQGYGYESDAIEAIDYAVKMGAKISNNSWGGSSYDPLLRAAIARARDQGHIFVAAAGNDGIDNDYSCFPSYPATYDLDNIVSVAAQNNLGELTPWSSYGEFSVDIAAPGDNILSTYLGGDYGLMSGTSMATPFVTGAISLVWDAYPALKYNQIIEKVFNAADVSPYLGGKIGGSRRLNVSAALGTYGPPKDNICPKVENIGFLASGNSLTDALITFTEAIDPASFTPVDITIVGPSGTSLQASSVSPEANSGGKVFKISFAKPGSTIGTYKLTIGSAIADLAGNLLDNNGNSKGGESGDGFEATFGINPQNNFANSNPVQIQDFQTSTSIINVGQDITISDLNVRLNLDHSWASDLVITLQGPGGVQATLFDQRGKGGKNLEGSLFDDESSKSIRDGLAPFAGSYQPENPLSAFDGKSAKGPWTISIKDRSTNDQGKLLSWSLEFTPKDGTSPTPVTGPSFISKNNATFDYGKKVNFTFEIKSTEKATIRAKDLPIGLELSPAGLLSGSVKPGSYSFKVIATTLSGQETSQNFTLVINKGVLNVQAFGLEKYPDGKLTAQLKFTDNRADGDKLDYIYEATFIDEKVGINKPIKISKIQIKGADAGNYTIGTLPSTAQGNLLGSTVTDGTLTVVGSSQDDKFILSMQGTNSILLVTVFGKSNYFTGYEIAGIKKAVFYGQDGNDEITENAEVPFPVTIYGGNGDDTLRGGNGNDTLYGELGNDTIYGGKGNDQLDGGAGSDYLYGQVGSDSLIAGQVDNLPNTLDGGDGPDNLQGSGGNDNLMGGDGSGDDGADIINGLAGDDSIFGGAGNDTIDGGDGNDSINGASGDDFILGGNGNDTLFGETGHDTVLGGIGDDSLDGGDGNDILVGGDGNDYLAGGAGLDFLIGGLGIDKLKGEGGDDIAIGGSTSFDSDVTNLALIQTEWTRQDITVPQRKTNLSQGVGPSKKVKLDATTIIDDKVEDLFFSSAGDDWMWI